MTGCAAWSQQIEDTPRGQYFQAQEVYIVAVTNLIAAKRAGLISQSDWDTIYNPAIQEGNSLLDLMDESIESSDAAVFNLARASLEAISRMLKGGA